MHEKAPPRSENSSDNGGADGNGQLAPSEDTTVSDDTSNTRAQENKMDLQGGHHDGYDSESEISEAESIASKTRIMNELRRLKDVAKLRSGKGEAAAAAAAHVADAYDGKGNDGKKSDKGDGKGKKGGKKQGKQGGKNSDRDNKSSAGLSHSQIDDAQLALAQQLVAQRFFVDNGNLQIGGSSSSTAKNQKNPGKKHQQQEGEHALVNNDAMAVAQLKKAKASGDEPVTTDGLDIYFGLQTGKKTAMVTL